MIFHEWYSAYYNAVARIITAILHGHTEEQTLNRIVCDNAFGESMLTVLPSLKSGKWQLVREDMTTPLQHPPTMPLTLVQKQWLKAISLDPRMKLFGVELEGLEDVEPLFTPADYVVYDKYGDGDPYEDENYIKRFRTLLFAIQHKQNVKIEMVNRKGNVVYARCVPRRLEYSEKDDKFRVVTGGCRFISTVNLARITKCTLYAGEVNASADPPAVAPETVTLRVSEARNTLERCMLHFAHFEKRAEKVDDHYLLHVCFHPDDEAELVIRILSFGPTVQVLGPEPFKNRIIDKLKSQKSCELL